MVRDLVLSFTVYPLIIRFIRVFEFLILFPQLPKDFEKVYKVYNSYRNNAALACPSVLCGHGGRFKIKPGTDFADEICFA